MVIINLWPCPGMVVPVVIVVVIVVIVIIVVRVVRVVRVVKVVRVVRVVRVVIENRNSSSNHDPKIFLGISGPEYFNCHPLYYCDPGSNINCLGHSGYAIKTPLPPGKSGPGNILIVTLFIKTTETLHFLK